MWRRNIYILVCFIMIMGMDSISVAATEYTESSKLVIALDPGHGGEEDGANYYGIQEKNLNLKMAKLLCAELQQYSNVEVVLVRDSDEEVTLYDRALRAKEADADILISMHFNASVSHKSNGASVYISTGAYEKEGLMQLADCLLGEFEAIGLNNSGLFARVTQMGGRRADGTFDDYYGVLRHAYNQGIPAMIVEHCYMDSEVDKEYFYTEEGLKQLAKADANGIAAHYGLYKATGETVSPKGATVFGATTKAVARNYYEAPKVKGIRLASFDGKTPGLATYQIDVEDGVGISTLYLVYKNQEDDSSFTVYLNLPESLDTGVHELSAYIPMNLSLGQCKLSYVGAYNEVGFDVGYNYWYGEMVGYGKCDWLNTFSYNGEADLGLTEETHILPINAKRIMKEKIELINKKRISFIHSVFVGE